MKTGAAHSKAAPVMRLTLPGDRTLPPGSVTAAYLCVSVHFLPLTSEVKFSNVLDVVASATPSMVTATQEPLPFFFLNR